MSRAFLKRKGNYKEKEKEIIQKVLKVIEKEMCGCESFNMHFTMTRILKFTLRTFVVILFGLANVKCGKYIFVNS